VDGNIFNSNSVHVGQVIGREVFDLKGKKLYDLRGVNLTGPPVIWLDIWRTRKARKNIWENPRIGCFQPPDLPAYAGQLFHTRDRQQLGCVSGPTQGVIRLGCKAALQWRYACLHPQTLPHRVHIYEAEAAGGIRRWVLSPLAMPSPEWDHSHFQLGPLTKNPARTGIVRTGLLNQESARWGAPWA
jgi:hypothetical protein